MALSFEIRSSQCVLFCEVDLEEKLALAAALKDSNRSRFDGEPLLLPIPPDAPSELPAVVLQSKDSSIALTMSATRVDVTVNHPPGRFTNIPALLEGEATFLRGIADALLNSGHAQSQISRVGVVLVLSAQADSFELGRVRGHFLTPQVTVGGRRSEFGFLDRQQWEDFRVNRWLRLATSQQADGSGSVEVILDFNTVPQLDHRLDSSRLGQFLEMLKSKADAEMEIFNG